VQGSTFLLKNSIVLTAFREADVSTAIREKREQQGVVVPSRVVPLWSGQDAKQHTLMCNVDQYK
jgi:hypothetical protein